MPDKNNSERSRDHRAAPDCRITRSASVDAELARIAAAEIDYALAEMRAAARKPGPAVHQCRKTIKRLRALVRLAGGDDAGREIDRKLRDAGRLLAAARDADVIRATADRLCADGALSAPVALAAAPATAKPDRELRQRVRDLLREARDALGRSGGGRQPTLETIGDSVERARRGSARLLGRFRERGGTKLAHDWRKSVQRYANQLKLMAGIWPERAAAELGPLDALAECLGEYNDLTILAAALEAGEVGADARSRSVLRRLARARQRLLRQRALALGESLFRRQETHPPPAAVEPEKDTHWL